VAFLIRFGATIAWRSGLVRRFGAHPDFKLDSKACVSPPTVRRRLARASGEAET
jgi:hypothetical protein